ncbi:hypothetical protein [Microcystis sp. M_OC_Ca_00000000_S217Cul]|uniref:hypothetical protein n=1 Tax=Microcystis sp. M_OC_Ca_00000000_S217Cul TaxID=2486214 RepID=UPI00257DCA9F|nr:hypothetical protein [Microcystis sp. M_OC_Ca_00000000_S217Cul]
MLIQANTKSCLKGIGKWGSGEVGKWGSGGLGKWGLGKWGIGEYFAVNSELKTRI